MIYNVINYTIFKKQKFQIFMVNKKDETGLCIAEINVFETAIIYYDGKDY